MKKIHIIDTWRRIKRTLITYFSIMLIVCLGISSYLGISFAKASMQETGDHYLKKQKFHNIQITYNYGLKEEDIQEIQKIDGVSVAEGLYQATGFLKLEDVDRLVTVQSATYQVDIANVIDGRLPKEKNEIVIEKVMADEDKIIIGDDIEIDCADEKGNNPLLETKFKVVGIVEHPAYSCNYVYSRRGLSDKGNGNCLNFFLVSDKAFDKEELDQSYQSVLVWSEDLSNFNCFTKQYEEECKKIEEKISIASKDRSELRYQKLLNDANADIDEAQTKLDSATEELNTSKTEIDNVEKEIEENKVELEELREAYPNSSIVKEGENALKKAEKELKTNKDKYEKAKKEYTRNKEDLDDAKIDVEKLVDIDWKVVNRNSNVSYALYSDNAEGLGKLSFSFAFVYIVVALMVCYSSIGRMIAKQKLIIGTQKALGYRTREILLQYIGYAWTCTFWGCAFGLLWAVFFVQPISLKSYKPIYYFQEYATICETRISVIVIAAAFILTLISTIFACKKVVSKPAVILLKEDVAKNGKQMFFERFHLWKKISLFKRTVIKNLIYEKRHMIATIIGVGGCTALMIIGFSLKYAMSDVKDIQFNHIQKFDISLQIEKDSDVNVFTEGLDQFKELEYINIMNKMIGVRLNGKDDIVADLLCFDDANMNNYFALEDDVTGEEVNAPKEGVLISSNTAQYYGIKVNDTIEVMKDNGEQVSVPVVGIVKNYVCHFLVMSPAYYENIIGENTKNNIFFIKLNGVDKGKIIEAFKDKEGYITVSGKEMGISIFDNIVDSLNSVVQVMIVLSAIMSLVVVLNLIAMYINEKSKALAVMRINGYTIREVKAFITYSDIILNFFGLIVGIILGVILATQIIKIIENDCVTYNHSPNIGACLISCGICIIYSIIVGYIAKRKINKLPLQNLNRFD